MFGSFLNSLGYNLLIGNKLIKAAVKVIIENVISNRFRVLLNLISEPNNPSLDDIRKLFKLDKERFELAMKDPKYSELER